MNEENYTPYSNKSNSNKELLDNFSTYEEKEVTITGRMMYSRSFGKLSFLSIRDESADIQAMLTDDRLDASSLEVKEKISIGDILQVKGVLSKTNKGDVAIKATQLLILAKAIKTIPSEHFGIKDEELRYKYRYLDLLLNEDKKELVYKRAVFWNSIRNFLTDKGFIEVYTPVLESIAGGASAEDFKTHHNALDIDVHLRISTGELWQKKLLIAGFEKTFEIGRIFRNEGISNEHLQDYTQMEFYWAYADSKDGMSLTKEMYRRVAADTFDTQKFTIRGMEIDLSRNWEEIDFAEYILAKTGLDVFESSKEEFSDWMNKNNLVHDKESLRATLVDSIWKHFRKQIAGPAFLTGHPVEISPLAKKDPDDPRKTLRFQPIIAGSEIGNGYSELNDPVEQQTRFEEQLKLKQAGDLEAQELDPDFIEALEYGMPPACGFGVSERFFSFLADQSIKEATTFPLTRPKNG